MEALSPTSSITSVTFASEWEMQDRKPMNQDEFDRRYEHVEPSAENRFIKLTVKYFSRFTRPFTSCRLFGATLFSFMPILFWLPRYDVKNNLLRDAIGGFMVGVMHVPQGIAYAFLAGVPPVVGLYTSFFPVLTYMLFGNARHNSIGSFAVVALMSGRTVYHLSHKTEHMGEIVLNVSTAVEPNYGPVEVASALTLAIGLVQLSIALLGLDFLTVFFSDQIVAGFTTGAAVHVFVTQLKDITGIYGTPRRGGVGNAILRVFDILVEIYRMNPTTVLVSAVAMTILYIGKKLINPHVVARSPVPVPFELLVVILGVIVSWFLQLETKFKVQIVGHIPTGLPLPSYPHLAILPLLIKDAIPIAVVIIAVHISMAKLLAKQHNYLVDGKQEIYALGFTSSISSCFPVYPNSCSLARTMVNASAGTKTQLFAIFSSIFIFFVLQFGGTFLRPLPMCILASIIIIALLDMFSKFKQLPRLWSISKIDWTIWVVTFLTTACIDVIEGLIIGILFALLTTLVRQQWPQWHILVNIPGTGEYRDVERYPQVNCIESVCVVRFDAPLLFTNVERFREMVEIVTTNWNTVSCNAELVPSEESLLTEEESMDSPLKKGESKEPLIKEENAEASSSKKTKSRESVAGEKKSKVSTTSDASKEQTRGVALHLPDKFLIVDCSGFVYVDMMGINCLKEVYMDSLKKSVRVLYAAAKAPLQKLLDISGFYSTVSKTNFFPTIHDAVYFARFRKSVVGLTHMTSVDNSYDTVELSDESTQDSDTTGERKASWLNPVYSTLRK